MSFVESDTFLCDLVTHISREISDSLHPLGYPRISILLLSFSCVKLLFDFISFK